MDDTLIDPDSKRADHFAENGPGESAANFRASQRQEQPGGGGPEKPIEVPVKPDPNHIRLDRRNRSEPNPIPETEKPTPTRVSKSFLETKMAKFNKNWRALLAVTGPTLVNFATGGTLISDISSGDYRSAAIKGVLSAASIVPLLMNKGEASHE